MYQQHIVFPFPLAINAWNVTPKHAPKSLLTVGGVAAILTHRMPLTAVLPVEINLHFREEHAMMWCTWIFKMLAAMLQHWRLRYYFIYFAKASLMMGALNDGFHFSRRAAGCSHTGKWTGAAKWFHELLVLRFSALGWHFVHAQS